MQAANNLIEEFTQKIGMNRLGLDEENQRSLSFDDKIIVSFIGESNDWLVALAYIGDIAKDADMRIFLEQNFMPEAHGGARFALEPKANRVVLACRWQATRISLDDFSADLEKYVNSAMRAQEYLKSGGSIEGEAAKPEASTPTEAVKPAALPDSLAMHYQNQL